MCANTSMLDEEIWFLVCADSDSEGEYLPSGNDEQPSNDHDCHGMPLHGDGGTVQCDKSVQEVESVCFDHSPSKGGRVRDKRGHGVRKRAGGRSRRSGGTQAKPGKTNDDDDDDGWVRLRDEEEYEGWIKDFNEPVGYRGDRDLREAKPLDFLSLFLCEDFWNLLTNETNRYAQQFLSSQELKPKSRFRDWYDVTISEMKAFLSLHLCMGVVEKPEIDDYWAEFWPAYTPGFGKVMPRNRFEIILSFLHFANNDEYIGKGQPGHDVLFKIRPVIDLIIPRFSEAYGPRKELSLDEMTIAFKGRSALKQYNPRKPSKYGYKAFVLSEACSGYVLRWFLYTRQDVDEVENVGATHRIVRQLMAPYLGKGHEVYMDSYYTTPAIANELADNDTGLCGTVNSNRREMPRHLRPTNLYLRRGDDPVFMRHGRLLACAWHDTKRFTMLSSLHGNSCVKKRMKTKHGESDVHEINQPACVEKYNCFMGGVDTADQRIKTYLFPHRSRKWYNRIFNAVLSISVVNSHIIYCKNTPGPHKPLKAFIQDIITDLLEGYSKKERNKGGRPSKQGGEIPQRVTERHWLRKTSEHPDCVVCSDRTRPKGRRQTKFRCSQCGVGLCAVPCNERYHTLKNFKQCHLDRLEGTDQGFDI